MANTDPLLPAPEELNRTRTLAWAFYDWANSAFGTTVVAGFFPVFYKQFWSNGVAATESSFWLGVANSLSSLIIMLLAPLLGAIADRGSAKKRLLVCFTFLGVVLTAALYWLGRGQWQLALLLYGIATFGFSGSLIFYDALIVVVAGERKLDIASAFGFALGYLGGGLLFAINVLMTLYPARFGLADAQAAVQVSFLTVAVWWGVFTLPLLLFVPEPVAAEPLSGLAAMRAGVGQLRETWHTIRQLRMVAVFLLAYWLYIDGVDTVIRMAVDYGLSLGFAAEGLVTALLITQFVGIPAALAFGKLGERIGAIRGIFIGIGAYALITVWGYFIRHPWEFYALAIAIGLVQGGVQSLSRSFYASIIPPQQAGEFFGFYNMLGKFAAVLGPILMGAVGVLTDTRTSILALLLLFVGGALLLARVDEAEARRMAQQL